MSESVGLTIGELAAYLGVPVATVYAWRSRGEGPRSLKFGKHVRYRPEEVEAWLQAHTDTQVAG